MNQPSVNGPNVSSDPQRERFLHPSTLVIPLLGSLGSLIVPTIFVAFWMNWLMKWQTMASVGFFCVVAPVTAYHALRYASFRYQLQGSKLIIRSGLLWREERRIPLARIQDAKTRQGLFHQLLGVVKLEITTAGGQRHEAILNVISMADADWLRAAFFEYQDGNETDAKSEAVVRPRHDLLRLMLPDLLLGGATSKLVATVGALLGAGLYFVIGVRLLAGYAGDWDFFDWPRRIIPEDGGLITNTLHQFLSWSDTLAGTMILVMGGLGIAVGGFAIRYHRFRLTRRDNILSKRHGLLTIRAGSVAQERIQALKVEETLLRRWLGLASIWSDSGGDRHNPDEEASKREPLVPIANRDRIYSLVEEVLTGLTESRPRWKKVSPKAVWRGTRIGWLVLILVAAPTALLAGWSSLLWLPVFPLIYFLNLKWYRHRGYWLDRNFLISRRGWFNRKTLYLPVRNLQNLSLRRNYFDRRLGLATLQVDTAGQANTGGGFAIHNLPVQQAGSIQRSLAQRVARIASG